MGFFKRFVNRARSIGRGVARGVQQVSGVVSNVLGKLDSLKNSPVGRTVMTVLMANPKTRNVAMKLDQAISTGADLSDLAHRMSKGEMDAINQAIDRAMQGRLTA